MKNSKFITNFIPILLNFMTIRFISQIDLAMVGRFGEKALAARAVPYQFMIIDNVLIFAICPIISIFVSKASNNLQERNNVIMNSIFLSLLIGATLTLVALLVYPNLLPYFLSDLEILNLSKVAIFWLSLNIFFRMLSGTSSMILYGIGKGKSVIPIKLLEVFFNFVLNYYFAFYLNLGFKGIFISTLFVSVVSSILLMIRVHKAIGGLNLSFRFLSLEWVKKFLSQAFPESIRVFAEQMVGFVILYFVAFKSDFLPIYSVSSELIYFFSMPIIAFMRASSIHIAEIKEESNQFAHFFKEYKNILGVFGICIAVVYISLLVFQGSFLNFAYALNLESNEWIYGFFVLLGPLLLVKLIISFQRSYLFANLKYSSVSVVDNLGHWLFLVPIAYLGIRFGNPSIFWLSFFISECLILTYQAFLVKKIN